MDHFISDVSEAAIRKERAKAREIRHSAWWKRKLAGGHCHYCGKEFPIQELTMDHIVPIIRGGKSTKGNMVPACKECNNRKKHMLPIEWEDYLHDVNREDLD